MVNFLTQLVQRAQGVREVVKPLIAPRFAPSMAIATDLLDFSTFEPSSLGGKTKIDLDRKPDTLSPENESTFTPEIVELMPSLPPGHWSANRSRLHQIPTLEPFEPFEFNQTESLELSSMEVPTNLQTNLQQPDRASAVENRDEKEISRFSPENRGDLSEAEALRDPSLFSSGELTPIPTSEEQITSISAKSLQIEELSSTLQETAPANSSDSVLPPIADNSPSPQQVNAGESNSTSQIIPVEENKSPGSDTSENPSLRSQSRENLSSTSSQAAPADSSSPQQVNAGENNSPSQIIPVEENKSPGSDTSENPFLRSQSSQNLPSTSPQAIPTNSPSPQQVNSGESNSPSQIIPAEENKSPGSDTSENPSLRSQSRENLPSTSPQAAPANSPDSVLPSQTQNYLLQQLTNLKQIIFPQKLQPEVKSKSSENPSLSQPIPPLNNSQRSPITENLPPKVSTQPTQEVSPSNQFSDSFNKSPSQPAKEQIKNSSTISPQTVPTQPGKNQDLPRYNSDFQNSESSSNPPQIREKPASPFSVASSVQQQLASPPLTEGDFPPGQNKNTKNTDTVNLANSPQQKERQILKPDLMANSGERQQSKQGNQREKDFNNGQSSGFALNDAGDAKNISPQQQLSSASGSTKTADLLPLVDLANNQHFQSSTSGESTQTPTKYIEINIGRIIVRAAEQQPTPPKSSHRRSKQKKPALSLNDYLKQRRSEDKGGR